MQVIHNGAMAERGPYGALFLPPPALTCGEEELLATKSTTTDPMSLPGVVNEFQRLMRSRLSSRLTTCAEAVAEFGAYMINTKITDMAWSWSTAMGDAS